jgi:hypothetical protein
LVRYLKTGIQYEDRRQYKNGNLTWRVFRNAASGQILYKYDKGIETSINKWDSGEYGSYWDLYSALDFWICNSDGGGCRNNPLYRSHKGINLSDFKSHLERDRKKEKTREEQEAKEIAEQKLQKGKEQQKQLEAEIRDRQWKFELTDFGKLQKDIKKDFEVWKVKSEYETVSDYEARIKNESASKLKAISVEKVAISQKGNFYKRPARIQKFNIDEQSFDILVRNFSEDNKYDTLKIFINKEYAQHFYERFNYSYSDENAIIIVPQELTMVDNYWKIAKALIVLDNFWTPRGVPLKTEYNIEGGNGSYSAKYDHYGIQEYKLMDINTHQSASLERVVFFYEWKAKTTIANSQKLDFNLEDLNMTSANSSVTK